jgi:adenine deaminase
LACGSDAGSPGVDHGLSVWRELALWTAAGLPLAWGIRCATLNAARTMRLERLGALLPGWQADWIAIPCAPEKILHVPPEAICIQGEYRRSAEGSA